MARLNRELTPADIAEQDLTPVDIAEQGANSHLDS
jgi:hypothetical protein